MKQVSISYPHHFEKQNLVTDNKGCDTMKCAFCGIEGKRHGLYDHIMVTNSVSDKKIQYCTGEILKNDNYKGKLIQVTLCNAMGSLFKEMIADSVHEIVTPPESYVNGDKGVWVMGIGEPVKLLFGEYQDYVPEKMIRTNPPK